MSYYDKGKDFSIICMKESESRKGLNPVISGRVSNDLWIRAFKNMNANPEKYNAHYKNLVIHLIDSCSRGYVSSKDCYDALNAKYIPEWVDDLRSAYDYLIR